MDLVVAPERIKKVEISNALYSGDVLTADGYFPEQVLDDNLPSNISFGVCPKDPEFKEYNKQTFTSTLQPGVYAREIKYKNQLVLTLVFLLLSNLNQLLVTKDCEWSNFHRPRSKYYGNTL